MKTSSIKNIIIFLALAVCLFIFTVANAQSIEIPMARDTHSQLPMDKMLADTFGGEGVEYYNKGYHYLYGKGVTQSSTEARRWFDLAAKSNSPAARYKIGRLYETGTFYNKDIEKAIFHYEFSAQKGDVYALNNLGILYLTGKGVKQDTNKGLSFMRRAAATGNTEAQVNLGLIYLNGTGVKTNKKNALEWFKEAGRTNNPEALFYLAEHAFAEQDYVQAYDYYLHSAQQSNSNAQLKLAMLYGKGLGINKDHEQSVKWLKESAKLENEQAIAILKRIKQK
jgi:TPR repeat protein